MSICLRNYGIEENSKDVCLLLQKFLSLSPDLQKSLNTLMYVIVEIAGKQFKAEKGRKLYVNRLQGDEGSSVSFDKVLLTDNDGQVKVGAPVVEGASVNAKILRHLKDDKVIVFKKKRRKGYKVKNGHRQFLTQILVEDITVA